MKIRELLSDESKWTQGVYARDSQSRQTGIRSDDAVCWCLEGARIKCYPSLMDRDTVGSAIYRKLDGESLPYWNDSHTFAEVKALVEDLDI